MDEKIRFVNESESSFLTLSETVHENDQERMTELCDCECIIHSIQGRIRSPPDN